MPSWREKHERIGTVKLLVVGAGGIGCELLKNLAATGFRKVHVIDLDTIDVSNLNRQFLFRKEHVSCSKSEIATKVVKQFCPVIDLTFDHDSIFEEKFNIDFFKQFDLVLNALDNKKARNHVNRMCHAANRPLVESGSSGYFGQVQVILRGKTECYECNEKPKTQKTFPGCTIRNTPSEHIHCTVWSKHVLNQLFGEVEFDEDVSPDLNAEDPEEQEEEHLLNSEEVLNREQPSEEEQISEKSSSDEPEEEEKEQVKIGVRQWAESVNFDPAAVFNKLFEQDIVSLCTIKHLWKQRKQPTPLTFDMASTIGNSLTYSTAMKEDTSIWSIATCSAVFAGCVQELSGQIRNNPDLKLSFDKDHPIIMAFVAACANIRAHIFSIPTKSMFEIKAMAGNIIPAIASTNAIVAGMMVTEAVKMIDGNVDVHCTFIRNQPNVRGKVFMEDKPYPPNPKCYVCSEKREVFVYVNPSTMTVNGLCEKVLKQELHMIAPDVCDVNDPGRVLISSDGETDSLLAKTLSEMNIDDGAILACDDFHQDMVLKLFIRQAHLMKGDEFEIARSDKEKEEEEAKKKEEEEEKRKRKIVEKDDEPETKRTKIDGQKMEEEENANEIVAME